jgi:Fur family ferric uptake transcriptional regulator
VPKDSRGDFDLLFHTLEFFGLCSACRTRQHSS